MYKTSHELFIVFITETYKLIERHVERGEVNVTRHLKSTEQDRSKRRGKRDDFHRAPEKDNKEGLL